MSRKTQKNPWKMNLNASMWRFNQYQYLSLEYKYQYQYHFLKTVLKYSSSTSTSTQYYNPAAQALNWTELQLVRELSCEVLVLRT